MSLPLTRLTGIPNSTRVVNSDGGDGSTQGEEDLYDVYSIPVGHRQMSVVETPFGSGSSFGLVAWT